MRLDRALAPRRAGPEARRLRPPGGRCPSPSSTACAPATSSRGSRATSRPCASAWARASCTSRRRRCVRPPRSSRCIDGCRRLTLVLLLPLAGIAAIVRLVSPAVLRGSRAVQDRIGDLSARAQENFAGVRVVRAYAVEEGEIAAFRAVNERLVGETLGLAKQPRVHVGRAAPHGRPRAARRRVARRPPRDGSASRRAARCVAFLVYLDMLLWPMISLRLHARVVPARLRRDGPHRRDPRGAAPETEAVTDAGPAAGSPAARARGAISIRGLTFRYPGVERARARGRLARGARGLDARRRGPRRVGQVDARLAPRAPLRRCPRARSSSTASTSDAFPLRTLRGLFAFVPQDGFLFSDTIRANVDFGARGAPVAGAVEAAAATAGLADDLAAFPRGTRHRRRRARDHALRRAEASARRSRARSSPTRPILVIDDALSAVDTRTEARILDGLRARARRPHGDPGGAPPLDDPRRGPDPRARRRARGRERARTTSCSRRGGWYARTWGLSASTPRSRSSRERAPPPAPAAAPPPPWRRRRPPAPPALRRARTGASSPRSDLVMLVVGRARPRWRPDLVGAAVDGPVRAGSRGGPRVPRGAPRRRRAARGSIARGLQQYVTVLTGQRIGLSLRQDVFAHLQRMGLSFFDRHPVGTLVTRVTSDVEAVEELFSSGVASIFYDVAEARSHPRVPRVHRRAPRCSSSCWWSPSLLARHGRLHAPQPRATSAACAPRSRHERLHAGGARRASA